MNRVRKDNYIVIQGWMLTELSLKGNELLVYAIIYGFSQSGDSQRYTGSLQYLADWTNSTKQGVMKNLKSLVDKGLIAKAEKIINGVKFCEYYATEFAGVLNSVDRGMQQSLPGGMQQSLPNNLDSQNLDDTINNTLGDTNPPKNTKTPKHKHGEYKNVLLTDVEVTKLCNEFGEAMAYKAIKFLDEYIEMKGYKAKSHYLAIRKWVINAVKEQEQKYNRGGYGNRSNGNVYTLKNGQQTNNPFLADLDKSDGDDLPFDF